MLTCHHMPYHVIACHRMPSHHHAPSRSALTSATYYSGLDARIPIPALWRRVRIPTPALWRRIRIPIPALWRRVRIPIPALWRRIRIPIPALWRRVRIPIPALADGATRHTHRLAGPEQPWEALRRQQQALGAQHAQDIEVLSLGGRRTAAGSHLNGSHCDGSHCDGSQFDGASHLAVSVPRSPSMVWGSPALGVRHAEGGAREADGVADGVGRDARVRGAREVAGVRSPRPCNGWGDRPIAVPSHGMGRVGREGGWEGGREGGKEDGREAALAEIGATSRGRDLKEAAKALAAARRPSDGHASRSPGRGAHNGVQSPPAPSYRRFSDQQTPKTPTSP